MMYARRNFLLGASASAAALILTPRTSQALVLGAGPAGAAAALSMARSRPDVSVVLIERDPTRLNPAMPRAGQLRRVDTNIQLDDLKGAGVSVLLDEATGIDWRAKRLDLLSGRTLAFDRICLAPGGEAVAEDITGLDARARHLWPAAWGHAREAHRLSAQLARMARDGHVVLRLPGEVSHPDVAFDRAVWLARFGARLTVLDGGCHTALKHAVLRNTAGRAVDWHVEGRGGRVLAVDASTGAITTDAGQLRADVVNFVPQQGAGRIARVSGLTDVTGWCPVDAQARSLLRPEVTLLGDAQTRARRTAVHAMRTAEEIRWG
ncbi:FAD-dependent oxidoreductase [Tropicimonas sp. S265A]|uniref:FAD-dependent oxidoreductase n=1 Tax=Tropicimonas sp. S265A TaxID=3415134 RepID=UPI003C7DF671